MENTALTMRYWGLMKRSRDLFYRIKELHGADVAQYVLTNGHKRKVVFKLNLRELYHFVRLRSDSHAQEEIRRISDRMVDEIRERYPIVASMLCGKDGFLEGRKRIPGCESKDIRGL
jgi:thymidylate synthase ThyX